MINKVFSLKKNIVDQLDSSLVTSLQIFFTERIYRFGYTDIKIH